MHTYIKLMLKCGKLNFRMENWGTESNQNWQICQYLAVSSLIIYSWLYRHRSACRGIFDIKSVVADLLTMIKRRSERYSRLMATRDNCGPSALDVKNKGRKYSCCHLCINLVTTAYDLSSARTASCASWLLNFCFQLLRFWRLVTAV